MMFVLGLVISALTERIRGQELEARRREERTAALYALSRELGGALDEAEVARIVARHTRDVFGGGAAVLTLGDDHDLHVTAQNGNVPLSGGRNGPPAGRSSTRRSRAGAQVFFRMRRSPVCRCVRARHPRSARDRRLSHRSRGRAGFLEAYGRQAAMAMERRGLRRLRAPPR